MAFRALPPLLCTFGAVSLHGCGGNKCVIEEPPGTSYEGPNKEELMCLDDIDYRISQLEPNRAQCAEDKEFQRKDKENKRITGAHCCRVVKFVGLNTLDNATAAYEAGDDDPQTKCDIYSDALTELEKHQEEDPVFQECGKMSAAHVELQNIICNITSCPKKEEGDEKKWCPEAPVPAVVV